ncbi:MAG: rRNA maturation RNase YbeY [Woeseiaceae bacterium]|nr:rRNA maturation RNase YbeY [Woeseiaceae bacterium]
MSVAVDIQVASDSADLPDEQVIERWIVAALDAAKPQARDIEVSVRIVDPDEMRLLNRDYRDKDKPTNVLSFPAGDIEGLPADAPAALGDIVVCAAVVADEAREQGKSAADHWAHMLVHGTLHLLGYDHISDADARAMEGLEVSILSAQGVADPYSLR